MRLSKAALDTCLDNPFFASLSVHGLHFTVYAPSIFSHYFVFSLFLWSFTGILGVQHREKILAFLSGFPCFFQKSKERKIREMIIFVFFRSFFRIFGAQPGVGNVFFFSYFPDGFSGLYNARRVARRCLQVAAVKRMVEFLLEIGRDKC